MTYLSIPSGSSPGLGQRELVGWPARTLGYGELVAQAAAIDGFAFDKSDIGPAQQTKIIALARQIMAQNIRSVRFVGHTDPVGTPAYNTGLGQRRADAVRRTLLATLDRMRPGAAASVAVSTRFSRRIPTPSRSACSSESARRGDPSRHAAARPQPGPSPETRTETVKIVARSSILPVGSATGSVPCTVSTVPGTALPIPSSAALRAFSAQLGLVVRDHIRSDAKDRQYRLYTQQSFRVACQNGQIVSVTPAPMDTDVGEECIIPSRGCLTPLPITITGVTLRRTAPDAFAFGWMGEGCPHPLAEVAFQTICRRTSRFIWHTISGTIRCGATGVSVGVAVAGSRFPTHAVFVNGALRASIPQGTLGMLWDPSPTNPKRVR